jgi:5-methylcytosine-specific restriction endonuclease McrA
MTKHIGGYKWNIIRHEVLERDCHTCQHCLEKKERLEVHHKIPVFLGGNPEPDNLISLCHACHMNYNEIRWYF